MARIVKLGKAKFNCHRLSDALVLRREIVLARRRRRACTVKVQKLLDSTLSIGEAADELNVSRIDLLPLTTVCVGGQERIPKKFVEEWKVEVCTIVISRMLAAYVSQRQIP